MPKVWKSEQVAVGQCRAGNDITAVSQDVLVDKLVEVGDVFQMVKVPADSTILEIILSTAYQLGTTCTVEVGDDADPDRYIKATSFGDAKPGLIRLSDPVGLGHHYENEATISIKVTGITNPVMAATITMVVIYTMQ